MVTAAMKLKDAYSSEEKLWSGPRVLLKGGPGNRGRSACGPTHVARLEFPRETGLILTHGFKS